MTYVQSFWFLKKMEMLLVSYERVSMRRNEGEGFTTGRDPSGGVFEIKLPLWKTSFQISYFFLTNIYRYFSLK